MSYIFNNQISYSDTFNLDAFGRLRVSEITSLLELKYFSDKLPEQVDEVLGGSATSTFGGNNAAIEMTVSNTGDYVIRQSLQRALYQPGKSQICEFSFSDFELDTNVIKRVGYFSSTTAATYDSQFDGFFLESNGINNQVSFQIWRTGNLILSSTTSDWDSSQVNPATIDWSKTQLAIMDFQWLGVGRVRFGLSLSGQTYIFKTHTGSNNLEDVYMTSPNQPIRYEIRSSGGTSTFHQICSQISSEGSSNNIGRKASAVATYSASTQFSASGTKYPYIGLRAGLDYSEIQIEVDSISIINTSNDPYIVTLEINPTLSSTPTFVSGNTLDYEYAVGNGTPTVTGDGYILATFLGEAGTSTATSFSFSNAEIKPGRKINGTRDQLWICIRPLGANATFYGSVNFQYDK
jgi:hypothetical protein